MRYEKMFVLKKVWKISIASLHRLTQDVQRANLRRAHVGGPYLNQIMTYLHPRRKSSDRVCRLNVILVVPILVYQHSHLNET